MSHNLWRGDNYGFGKFGRLTDVALADGATVLLPMLDEISDPSNIYSISGSGILVSQPGSYVIESGTSITTGSSGTGVTIVFLYVAGVAVSAEMVGCNTAGGVWYRQVTTVANIPPGTVITMYAYQNTGAPRAAEGRTLRGELGTTILIKKIG